MNNQTVIVSDAGSQVIPALLNVFCCPGLGQLVQGRILAALLWWAANFLAALSCFILVGFVLWPIVWIACIVDAARYNPLRVQVHSLQPVPPAYAGQPMPARAGTNPVLLILLGLVAAFVFLPVVGVVALTLLAGFTSGVVDSAASPEPVTVAESPTVPVGAEDESPSSPTSEYEEVIDLSSELTIETLETNQRSVTLPELAASQQTTVSSVSTEKSTSPEMPTRVASPIVTCVDVTSLFNKDISGILETLGETDSPHQSGEPMSFSRGNGGILVFFDEQTGRVKEFVCCPCKSFPDTIAGKTALIESFGLRLSSPDYTVDFRGSVGLITAVAVTPITRLLEPKPTYSIWTNTTGEFSVEAALVDFKDGMAHLERKDNGQVIRIKPSLLSEADQERIKLILRARRR